MGATSLVGGRFGRRAGLLLCVVVLASSCSGGSAKESQGPSNAGSEAPATTPSVGTRPSPAPSGSVALVGALPAGCEEGVPAADATAAFVAEGRAWAVTPDGVGLSCLFDVSNPGPFTWGPMADRVLLADLAVQGVGSTAHRPPGGVDPGEASWGRPQGLAIAFVDPDGAKVEKAIVDSERIDDVTPFDNVAYQSVVYHPSGLALGMVLTDSDGSSIWMTSNTGSDPKRLVWSKEGTVFGPIAFGGDGTLLYYAAHLANGRFMLAQLDLGKGEVANDLWVGDGGILRVLPGVGKAGIDTGTGCDDRQAVLSKLDGTAGSPFLPDAAGPTSVIGWLDQDVALVAEGGCSGPFDLWTADIGTGTAQLLAAGVDRAAVRLPDPLPTPALPDIGVSEGAA